MIIGDFKNYFISLSAIDKQDIINELIKIFEANSNVTIEQGGIQITCPHCKGEKIRGNGFSKDKVQKYYCNTCKKYFCDNTTKVWYFVKKKSAMQKYIYGLLSGYSIRKSAEECEISVNTSFIWRHKLLSCFNKIGAETYKGILEVDELFFPVSEKGSRQMTRPARKRSERASKRGISDEQVAVIATSDREGNKGFSVTKLGRITKENVSTLLDGKIDKVDILCSDKHVSYKAYTKEKKIPHKTIMASHNQRVTEKIYHVQNVNNMDKRVRDFMRPRNGVATKYLQNYLNWFLALEKIKNSLNRHEQIGKIIFTSVNAITFFHNISLNHILLRT